MNDPLTQSILDKIAIFTWPSVGVLFIFFILKPFVPIIIEWWKVWLERRKELIAQSKDKVAQMYSLAATSFEERLAVAESNALDGRELAEKIKNNHLHDVENRFDGLDRQLEKLDGRLDTLNDRLIVVETIQKERLKRER